MTFNSMMFEFSSVVEARRVLKEIKKVYGVDARIDGEYSTMITVIFRVGGKVVASQVLDAVYRMGESA